MPHLVVLYTPTLDTKTDISLLCRSLCNAMLAVRGDDDKQVFPTGGTRVLAFAAAHAAVADGGAAGKVAGGSGDYGFVYLQLRMTKGRSAAVHQRLGAAITDAAGAHFATLLAQEHIGITVQIDEGAEVFNGKHSSLHPLFAQP